MKLFIIQKGTRGSRSSKALAKMSDFKCPSGYEHITDDSNSVEDVATGTQLFHTNHITCYNGSSLPPSVNICRYEDNEIVGRWHLCRQQDSTSSGVSVPWTEVAVPIAFFACLACLLWVLVNWKRGNMTQPSLHEEDGGCEISTYDTEMTTPISDVHALIEKFDRMASTSNAGGSFPAREGQVAIKEEHHIEMK